MARQSAIDNRSADEKHQHRRARKTWLPLTRQVSRRILRLRDGSDGKLVRLDFWQIEAASWFKRCLQGALKQQQLRPGNVRGLLILQEELSH